VRSEVRSLRRAPPRAPAWPSLDPDDARRMASDAAGRSEPDHRPPVSAPEAVRDLRDEAQLGRLGLVLDRVAGEDRREAALGRERHLLAREEPRRLLDSRRHAL